MSYNMIYMISFDTHINSEYRYIVVYRTIAYIPSIVLKIEQRRFLLQTIWENVLVERFYFLGYIAV
jgi:hypothetical protein